MARARCWRYDWVLDLDIKGFFDSIDWELLLKAVRHHTDCSWVLLYVERWLQAPQQMEDGSVVSRIAGTPQGGVISPLLANLFLHYAFDRWLAAHYPQVTFERYADDAIVHCRSEKQAQEMRRVIAERLRNCGLELHPEKTKIVYCKDDLRRGTHPNEKFDFLGFTFRPRRSKNRKGQFFINFSPAVSNKAAKAIRDQIRSWKLPKRSDKAIEDLSRMFNPIIRGWLQYYGRYYRSALYPPMRGLDRDLALWAKRKYKKLRGHLRRATHWIARLSRRAPELFAHWQMGVRRGSVMGAV
jgi:RNA-directed DNA polymerase